MYFATVWLLRLKSKEILKKCNFSFSHVSDEESQLEQISPSCAVYVAVRLQIDIYGFLARRLLPNSVLKVLLGLSCVGHQFVAKVAVNCLEAKAVAFKLLQAYALHSRRAGTYDHNPPITAVLKYPMNFSSWRQRP